MKKKAFTLVELMVVISIISMLMTVLVPAIAKARQQGKAVVCMSNVRQLAIAADVYTQNNDSYYPIAQTGNSFVSSLFTTYRWDFTIIMDWSTGTKRIEPGILWQGGTIEKIQLCPSYKFVGKDMVEYTGYNYNTSYIGHGKGEAIETPAKVTQVKRPGKCALFGDGSEGNFGVNNFMRAPWPSKGDTFFGRWAGAQGYRHNKKTTVAYCDGSARSTGERYTDTEEAEAQNLVPGTGFLSSDNSAYDLE